MDFGANAHVLRAIERGSCRVPNLAPLQKFAPYPAAVRLGALKDEESVVCQEEGHHKTAQRHCNSCQRACVMEELHQDKFVSNLQHKRTMIVRLHAILNNRPVYYKYRAVLKRLCM